ncbi:hypothetical protein A2627_05545 [Candidatus Woesebacteria bacterium RIFCSPHIGHO2_01_FULL_39_28]|uniref:Uncharacterized protein n=1 Tax=Candidatus Woesebacteria bacterium RIFCSPHIGHO2_01_FULL_39_28 TaxID=1802496 RepID=A0A1F7YI39_9BACT|nr:MAG: hypothetical protein A2627_05545 [Candidatus Woesebacteria bacterium RIFCSPHIGHO2_01_FULL_39_28]OGM56643.1 MAG: hypothetical protein A3A50_04740 [Candidatus Woesebacteria bacterium RIFCSPLOWO2_01_FULL_38_20]
MAKDKKKPFGKKIIVYTLLFLMALILGAVTYYKNYQSKFDAPRENTQSIQFTIRKDFTLQAVIGDLHYFDFIKDETAFQYALEQTKDTNPGRENAIKVGSNTIDSEATYTISQSMTAWQIADILLNQGEYTPCDHGCPDSFFNPELLPGGDLAPTLKEKYSWVNTYDDCIKAIGHDGGQLSSEQYFQRTGIRRCVAPDGREFTQGKEGWSEIPSP